MSPTGRDPRRATASVWLAALLLSLVANLALAAVEMAVDRQQIALGESFNLVISAEDPQQLRELDLRRLEADFRILQRSQSSSTSIINGQRRYTEQLSLELTPLREGSLSIPALGGARAIAIDVEPPIESTGRNDEVLFSAELDRDSVHVQQQAILTLRIEQAINLEARSLSELKLDNAFVLPLEQRSFQRTVDGRPWLVHEVRYAIFPERSGELTIPEQIFTARESRARRSGINFGLGGTQLQRRSQPLTLQVEPRPDSYPPGSTWLPARGLTLEQSWSNDLEGVRVGDSLTRTVTLRAEGLQGAQLPPIDFSAPEGLRFYTDQPTIEDQENPQGIVGLRRDSAALVASEPGEYTLPAIRVAWWDTTSDTLRYAELPEQRIRVSAAAAGAAPAERPAADTTTGPAITQPAPGHVAQAPVHWLWPGLSVLLGTGWLLTALLWWRSRRHSRTRESQHPHPESASERQAWRQLQAACTSHSPAAARRALLAWCRAHLDNAADQDLYTLAERLGDSELRTAIDSLEQALYSPIGGESWRGDTLLAAVGRLREHSPSAGKEAASLSLYPVD